jgi:ATPase subunit of ABC transporter with duplicated ATPase domains
VLFSKNIVDSHNEYNISWMIQKVYNINKLESYSIKKGFQSYDMQSNRNLQFKPPPKRKKNKTKQKEETREEHYNFIRRWPHYIKKKKKKKKKRWTHFIKRWKWAHKLLSTNM